MFCIKFLTPKNTRLAFRFLATLKSGFRLTSICFITLENYMILLINSISATKFRNLLHNTNKYC